VRERIYIHNHTEAPLIKEEKNSRKQFKSSLIKQSCIKKIQSNTRDLISQQKHQSITACVQYSHNRNAVQDSSTFYTILYQMT
jgi:hypothetical protein